MKTEEEEIEEARLRYEAARENPDSLMTADELREAVRERREAEERLANQPETYEDLANYILDNAESIYVREKNADDKWDSLALTELPPKKAMEHAMRFFLEGRIPVVVKDPGEEE